MKKQKAERNKLKNPEGKNFNNGITLIALIITIVVLLILAGVSIATLTGDNGVLTKAAKAREETKKASIEEQRRLAMLEAAVNLENQTYIDKNGEKATIPAGFAPTRIEGEDIIEDGLVIIDSKGNEFVWIPVSQTNFETEFIRRAGYSNESPQDISNYAEENGDGNNSKLEEIDSIHDEAIAMYGSVYDNEGFYIGRYETGFIGDEAKGSYNYYEDETDANVATETAKLVVQKGAQVYNYVPWGAGMEDISAAKEGDETTPKYVIGAVELARNFARVNGYDTNKVHSTLCYGVQWDTALNFIDPGYTGYAKSSSGMGWYYNNYNSTDNGNTESNQNYITGKDLIYEAEPTVIKNKHKNIYDMGGNVFEWTMEAYNTNYRVFRGGSFYSGGSGYPASYRHSYKPFYSIDYIGFRLALYVE